MCRAKAVKKLLQFYFRPKSLVKLVICIKVNGRLCVYWAWFIYSLHIILTDEVPSLSLAHFPEPISPVGFITNERSEYGVTDLTNKNKISRKSIVEIFHLVEIYDHVRKPHRSCEVIEHVTDTVRQFLEKRQVAVTRRHSYFGLQVSQ